MPSNFGYIIPEFPSQTHIWIWREIRQLRQWKLPIQLFSTRRPQPRDRARHAFAQAAEAETIYLWPPGVFQAIGCLLWAVLLHPIGFLRAVKLGLCLPVNKRPRWRHVLPLIIPACVMAKAAKRLNISHFHSHTCSNSAIICMMVKRLVGIPFSMTLNANIEWWGGAMKEKFQDARFTIAITQWLLDQMRRDYPSLGENQRLLGRIGVDTTQWTPAEHGSGQAAGITRLITVGRLHESKGHDILLEAVKRLVAAGHEITLEIIGEGPQRAELESRSRESGLSDRVRFLGSLSEQQIIERMREADLFVLASHAEPLGVVYMEAMSMQVATIGTAAGGVGEIITTGVDGILVPPRDAEALADAIGNLIKDKLLRRRLAAAGRRTIIERFDSRLGAATVYEQLTGEAPTIHEL